MPTVEMTPEFEADLIAQQLDYYEFEKVAPGVLKFNDQSGGETKWFHLIVEEIVVFRVGAGVLEFEDESAQEVKRFRLTVEEI